MNGNINHNNFPYFTRKKPDPPHPAVGIGYGIPKKHELDFKIV